MDKVAAYKKITITILQQMVEERNVSTTEVKAIPVYDEERGHYCLFQNSWKNEKRIYGCYVHVEVADTGKVWLHFDGTDIAIGQKLLDAGVQKQDLVLSWIAPYRRQDTGLAVG